MFDALSGKITGLLRQLRKKGSLSEKDVDAFLRDVRVVLLESDIHFRVVRDLIAAVREKAVAQQVLSSISPGDQVAKIVYEELLALMTAPAQAPAPAKTGGGPRVWLMAGLQGAGKTTACVKLARFLEKSRSQRVGLVAADLARPAAVDQLRVLAQRAGLEVYGEDGVSDPVALSHRGLEHWRARGVDHVIVDTAGRLHIDEALMQQVRQVREAVAADEVLLVLDAMTGQEALRIAEEFDRALPVTGAVVSKMDGDARGGCAVSFRAVTGKPIRFLSTGEKAEDFEEFVPERVVGRIFDLGDLMGMVERAQEAFRIDEAQELERQMRRGSFTFEDLLAQVRMIRKMGGLGGVMAMMPGMSGLTEKLGDPLKDGDPLKSTESVILSMTRAERLNPDLIDGSRRQRIARGSGHTVAQVNEVIRNYLMMRKMMKGNRQLLKRLNRRGGTSWHP